MALTSSGASGQSPPIATDPVYVPFGTLTIELGDRSGQLVFDPAAPGDDVTQPLLNEQPCNQITLGDISAGTGDLLSLVPLVNGVTGPGDSVQQPGEFLGVQTAGENCGRQAEVIGPDELLEIGLGSHFNSDVFVRSFGAAVDKKFNNDGDLTVGFDSGPQGLTKDVATGGSLVSITGDEIPGGVFTSATFASTSNKDNRGLSIGDATLELVTLSDEFDVAVFCGEQVPKLGDAGDIAQSATYLRLDNKNNDPCEDVGVRVEIQDADATTGFEERVFWNNSFTGIVTGSTQRVQAFFTIVWRPTADSADLDRTIDYDGDESNGVSGSMLWCDGRDPITGLPILPPFTGQGAIDVDPSTVGIDLRAPWCLVEDDRNLDADGLIAQTQTLFGSGDPWAR